MPSTPKTGKPLDLLGWLSVDHPVLDKFADWADRMSADNPRDAPLGVHPCPACGLMHSPDSTSHTESLPHEEGTLGRGY